jgi:hypothetical protein
MRSRAGYRPEAASVPRRHVSRRCAIRAAIFHLRAVPEQSVEGNLAIAGTAEP